MIAEFFKKNLKGFNYGNFIVTKIQVSLVLMVLVAFIYFLIDFHAIVFLELIFSLVFFHALLIEARKKFPKDFKYFLLVFGLMYIVIQMIWINNTFIPIENRMDVGFLLIFFLIVVAVIFSVLLKKNEVEGKVICSNGKVTVIETEFDLRSFTKGGKYIIETQKQFKEGKKIKVKIKKSVFGKQIEIIE
jgi:uncharacterized membrane protein